MRFSLSKQTWVHEKYTKNLWLSIFTSIFIEDCSLNAFKYAWLNLQYQSREKELQRSTQIGKSQIVAWTVLKLHYIATIMYRGSQPTYLNHWSFREKDLRIQVCYAENYYLIEKSGTSGLLLHFASMQETCILSIRSRHENVNNIPNRCFLGITTFSQSCFATCARRAERPCGERMPDISCWRGHTCVARKHAGLQLSESHSKRLLKNNTEICCNCYLCPSQFFAKWIIHLPELYETQSTFTWDILAEVWGHPTHTYNTSFTNWSLQCYMNTFTTFEYEHSKKWKLNKYDASTIVIWFEIFKFCEEHQITKCKNVALLTGAHDRHTLAFLIYKSYIAILSNWIHSQYMYLINIIFIFALSAMIHDNQYCGAYSQLKYISHMIFHGVRMLLQVSTLWKS